MRLYFFTFLLAALLASCAFGGQTTYGDAEGGKLSVPITNVQIKTYSVRVQNPFPFTVKVFIDNHYAGFLYSGNWAFARLNAGSYYITLTDPYNQIVAEYEQEVPVKN